MAKKLTEVRDLSEKVLTEITSSKESWLAYLSSSANLYKYPFHDAVLIHAQRPDTKAVASIQFWNKRFNRYVNRGTKGIALIDDHSDSPKVKYVFALEDTHGGKSPNLWSLNKTQQDNVINALEEEFVTVESSSFEHDLSKIILFHIEEAMTNYAHELYLTCMEETGDFGDYLEVYLKNTLLDSSTFMIFQRLGIQTPFTTGERFLATLDEFQTPRMAALLGTAVHNISGDILKVIEHSVKQQEKALNNKERVSNERSSRNELQGERRSSISTTHDEQKQQAVGTLWEDEETVFEIEEASPLQLHAIGGQPNGVSSPSGSGSVETNGDNSGEVGEGTTLSEELERLPEISAPPDVARYSGRNRDKHTDSQQLAFFTEEAESSYSASFSNDDYSHYIIPALMRGSITMGGKNRIIDFLTKENDRKECLSFLKEEFGTGGFSIDFPNERHGFAQWTAKGYSIRVSPINNESDEIKINLSWTKVYNALCEMISTKQFNAEVEILSLLKHTNWLEFQTVTKFLEDLSASSKTIASSHQ